MRKADTGVAREIQERNGRIMAGSSINVRELAMETLTNVDREKKTASEAMNITLRNYQYMSKQERSFYTRLCNGTLENRIQLDYKLDRISKTPVHKCKPYIRSILRMSAYQILFMNSIPDSAVCNEAVLLAKKKGFRQLTGFVNGVLRNLIRQKDTLTLPERKEDPVKAMAVQYSIPEWLVEKMLSWYPEEITERIFRAFLQESPLTVRINLLRTTREEVKAGLAAAGVKASDGHYTDNTLQLTGYNYLNRIRAFREGLITVQDESSVLQGYLIHPKAGDRILDICAAPGGKSMQAAERLGLTDPDRKGQPGSVLARDISASKVERIQENLERMQYSNIETQVWDAVQPDPSAREQFDFVIADVPCSGLGVIGRKQDIKYRIRPEQLTELVHLQREILKQAVTYVKPGGRLIYSTCTIHPGENEEQVGWLTENYPLEPEDLHQYLPETLVNEVKDQPGTDLEQGYTTLLPGLQSCDGFFMAAFRKKKN